MHTYLSLPGGHTYSSSALLAGRQSPLHRAWQPALPPPLQACHLLRMAVENLGVVLGASQQGHSWNQWEELYNYTEQIW